MEKYIGDTKLYFDLQNVTIITGFNDKKLIDKKCLWTVTEEGVEIITLDSLIEQLQMKTPEDELLVTVLCESPLEGYVYEYGNHGPYWVVKGMTQGYA